LIYIKKAEEEQLNEFLEDFCGIPVPVIKENLEYLSETKFNV
jgi:hypothetical protein